MVRTTTLVDQGLSALGDAKYPEAQEVDEEAGYNGGGEQPLSRVSCEGAPGSHVGPVDPWTHVGPNL
ncbi:hypothetical protein L13192_03883 [Pyrenophora tritici-repentis]|nr:hypothetical protein L13192_03883 [Pyrenophora tritici-repentis]